MGFNITRPSSDAASLSVPASIGSRIRKSAFAFRGYNTTNLGKTPELLDHPVYGSIVEGMLRRAGEVCADTTHKPCDLVTRVRNRQESTLDSFAEDVALIVGVELAQMKLLDEIFGIAIDTAAMSFGYSIGELSALVVGKTFTMEQILPVPLVLAADCAELAHDVTMGVLFSRGKAIDLPSVQKLCVHLSSEGKGLISPSAYLSPNTILLLAEGNRLNEFRLRMKKEIRPDLSMRANTNRWPPLHTSLVWRKSISSRAALALHAAGGGFKAPVPKVVSCVTGKANYNDFNAREILTAWTEKPQLLWNVVQETLAEGVERVIHVGPEPNLIVGTFERLSTMVGAQMAGKFLLSLGQTVGQRIAHSISSNAWLAGLLSSNVSLLRAPFVENIVLEDWLLAQKVDRPAQEQGIDLVHRVMVTPTNGVASQP